LNLTIFLYLSPPLLKYSLFSSKVDHYSNLDSITFTSTHRTLNNATKRVEFNESFSFPLADKNINIGIYIISNTNRTKVIGKCTLNPLEIIKSINLKLECCIDKNAVLAIEVYEISSSQQVSIRSFEDTSSSTIKTFDEVEDKLNIKKYSVRTLRKLQTTSSPNIKAGTQKDLLSTMKETTPFHTDEVLLITQLKKKLADEMRRHRQLIIKLEEANRIVSVN